MRSRHAGHAGCGQLASAQDKRRFIMHLLTQLLTLVTKECGAVLAIMIVVVKYPNDARCTWSF